MATPFEKAAASLTRQYPVVEAGDPTITSFVPSLGHGAVVTGYEGVSAEVSVTHGSLTLAYGDQSAEVTMYLTPASAQMLIRALQLLKATFPED